VILVIDSDFKYSSKLGEKPGELVLANMSFTVLVELCPDFFEATNFFSGEETKFAGALVDIREIFVDDGEKLESQ